MISYKVFILLAMAAFCALSLALKENYPFSHFPMYGDPEPVASFYYLADGDGRPLPIATLTGKTPPKLGKMLRAYRDERLAVLKKAKPKLQDLPPEEWPPLCQKTLAYLRQQAGVLKKDLPAKLQIIKTSIRYENGAVKETPEVFFAE